MREAIVQSLQNLRANKLRSFLTMFGILWGMISIVVLSATGEGFRRGNEKVLLELGKNIAIVWGGRTSLQAGGERAGRQILLTLDDARALAAESSMIAVVSPELERPAVRVKSAYNAATVRVSGIEPQYQEIRTIELESGRNFTWTDEEQVARVAIVGFDMAEQLFGKRHILGEPLMLNGMPYTVVGKIRKKKQDSNYSGPDNNKIFVPFAAMIARHAADRRARPARSPTSSSRRTTVVVDALPATLDERTGRIEDIDWPLERNVRAILARRHGFDPDDKQAIAMWDTSLQTLMFGRMIGHMKQLLHHRRRRDAGARRHRRDEHHADRGQGADARNRHPQGARRDDRRDPAAVLPRRLLPDDGRAAARACWSRSACARWSTWRRCPSASPE